MCEDMAVRKRAVIVQAGASVAWPWVCVRVAPVLGAHSTACGVYGDDGALRLGRCMPGHVPMAHSLHPRFRHPYVLKAPPASRVCSTQCHALVLPGALRSMSWNHART